MSGRVCDKHQEWCPEGTCQWCEPEPLGLLAITAGIPDTYFNFDVPIVIHYPGCNTNSSTCTCGKIADWPARPS